MNVMEFTGTFDECFRTMHRYVVYWYELCRCKHIRHSSLVTILLILINEYMPTEVMPVQCTGIV